MTSSVNPLSEKTQIWGFEASMYLVFSSSFSNSVIDVTTTGIDQAGGSIHISETEYKHAVIQYNH